MSRGAHVGGRRASTRGWPLRSCALTAVGVALGAVAAWQLQAGPWARQSGGDPGGAVAAASTQVEGGGEAAPMTVSSVTPAPGSSSSPGNAPVTVTFSDRLANRVASPTLSPAIPGSWARSGSHSLTFIPAGAYLPGTVVTVTIPGGRRVGVRALDGTRLAATVTAAYTVGPGSVVRLQQLLSLLDYSPLTWTPSGTPIPPSDAAAQEQAIFSPPPGTFTWTNSGWPDSLVALWQEGAYNVFTQGLVMEFQADHGLVVNGVPSAALWGDLLAALAANQVNTGGYNYALASKLLPETLTIWHDGQQVLQSPANTGIPVSPTDDGTYPVYLRYRSQIMRGTNPDGTPYADPVQYVAYFNGGDAVHYLPRASYGFPQSLGCVELPLTQAAQAWPYLAYGTLVTVTG